MTYRKTKELFTDVIICGMLLLILSSSGFSQDDEKHLFILSGQSNMASLNPNESFIPAIEQAFGKDQVIVVKSAFGGQPIRRWYREWSPWEGSEPQAQPDLYDTLMTKIQAAMPAQPISTVTFIWMQGERDAREGHGNVYAQSLSGLYRQLSQDLERDDMNFVIGRLSDFDLANERYPDWTMIRDIQVKLASSNPRFAWIDTDDLNDGINQKGDEIQNDLHMSMQGYNEMGRRFAEKSIQLITSHRSQTDNR